MVQGLHRGLAVREAAGLPLMHPPMGRAQLQHPQQLRPHRSIQHLQRQTTRALRGGRPSMAARL